MNLIPQLLSQSSPVYDAVAKAAGPDRSLSKKERQKLAPKNAGLNIEGLCCYPPNQSLLIGLRNPLFPHDGETGGDAIVIELLNPQAVVDAAADAQFGGVFCWDLDNRGIRGMTYSGRHKTSFILAGAVDSETTSALYQWDGDFAHQPILLYAWPETDSFNPEGIAEGPSDGLLWIFSDDGALEIPVDGPDQCRRGELLGNGTCPNKYLTDITRKTFRVRTLNPLDMDK